MGSLLQDVRYALRQLRRAPGFAATAILTLALGIGATTAIFTLVYQVLLRSLPVTHPEQLYKLGTQSCGGCTSGGLQDDWIVFSTDLYHLLRDHTPGIEGMAASEAGAVTASVRQAGNNGAALPLDVRFVSGNYFSVLGVQPYQGRLLYPTDDREGAAPAAVMSYMLWKTKFAGDPHLVGSSLLITGHPVTVVGIAAQDFLGERNQADPPGLWLPLPFEPILEPDRSLNKFPVEGWLNVLVRISDPRNAAPAEHAIRLELRQWIAANRGIMPEPFTDKELARQTTDLVSALGGINDLRDEYETGLKLLLFVTGFVLLIACANLANLMIVRGIARQQEVAMRSALGASRFRLVRQTLVEAWLLALAGGVAALTFAYAGTHAIIALAMSGVAVSPIAATPSMPVLSFAFAVSLVSGLLFGIAPAWITSHSTPAEALRGTYRSTSSAGTLPQKLLVILQTALSLALLSTSGLLITSLRQLEHQNFHFQPDDRFVASVDLASAGYSYTKLGGLYRRMDDTLSHLPGVENFAYATYGPMTFSNWATDVFFPGRDTGLHLNAWYDDVSSHYFEAVGTQVLLGRAFNEGDTETSPRVAIVNQSFVAKYLEGKRPIGEHFGPDPKMPSAYEIVGVVEDTKYGNPAGPVRPMFFAPMTQTLSYPDERDLANEHLTHYAGNLVVHYHGDEAGTASSVRCALKNVDPNIPLLTMRTYKEQLDQNFTREELITRLTALFGLLALILAAIGVYGVTAYGVGRRTAEIGIRMALGARRLSVLSLILRGALSQALLGLALGLLLALGAAKLLAHTLYQTAAFQPLVLASVAMLLLLSAVIAAFIPAGRAALIDPVQAMRAE